MSTNWNLTISIQRCKISLKKFKKNENGNDRMIYTKHKPASRTEHCAHFLMVKSCADTHSSPSTHWNWLWNGMICKQNRKLQSDSLINTNNLLKCTPNKFPIKLLSFVCFHFCRNIIDFKSSNFICRTNCNWVKRWLEFEKLYIVCNVH